MPHTACIAMIMYTWWDGIAKVRHPAEGEKLTGPNTVGSASRHALLPRETLYY